MRRVMAVIGFSSFFVSMFCIYFGKGVALTLCILAAIALITLLAFKKLRIAILALLFATISVCSLNCFLTDSKIDKYVDAYCDKEITISATVKDNGNIFALAVISRKLC